MTEASPPSELALQKTGFKRTKTETFPSPPHHPGGSTGESTWWEKRQGRKAPYPLSGKSASDTTDPDDLTGVKSPDGQVRRIWHAPINACF